MKKTIIKALLLGCLVGVNTVMAQTKKAATTKKTPSSASIQKPIDVPMPAATIVNLAPPERVLEAEGITEFKLPNGLKVLLFPDESKNTITVNITYLVGSRHENYGETGMAHLLEHLVFKGTPKHKNIPQELSSHGSNPNGTTWLDRTNYFETFQANDENLEWALDLEADRMVNSFIARKDLDTEMTVVRNEFESGENYPTNVLMKKVTSTAFDWHNYGNSTIGARADIENVNIERLQGFYKKYYQPDNAVLLVAGKFDVEKTLKLISKYFGVIPKPSRLIEKTYTLDPTQDGEKQVTLRRVGDVQAMCLLYKMPSGLHDDFVAASVMTDILADQPSGRLYKALVETKKASSIYGFGFQNKEPGMMYFLGEVRKESNLDSAKNILIDVVENFGKAAPTEEEVERIKTKNLSQIDLFLNSSENVGLYLSEYIAQGDWRLLFYNRNRLKNIKADDVKRVAEKYLVASNRTLGLFLPTEKPIRAEIPETPNVADLLKDFKGGEAKAKGEVFDPSPVNIDKRTINEKVGGIILTMLPKKTRGNSVNLQMTTRFGTLESLNGKATVAEFTKDMLNKGTKTMNRQQIQDALDKLKARVNFYNAPDDATVNIETEKDNLIPVLKIVKEIMRDPIFPAEELEKLKNERIAGLEQQISEPSYKAVTALRRHLSPYTKGHPKYVMTVEEQVEEIKALKVDDIKKFYSDFYGASDAILAAVGDFEVNELKSTTQTLFGDWKSPKPYIRVPNQVFNVEVINKKLEAPDKANSFYFAGINLPIGDKDTEYPALLLANEILGGGFLNSRLATRIRQKEGISYGVGSFLNADSFEKKASFGVYAIYAPENLPRLEAAVFEEIDKVLATGFTEIEIEEAKKGMLQNNQVSRSQDGNLVDKLANNPYLKRTLAYDLDLETKIKNLTNAQLMAAMKKYIVPSKISVVKAGDFEGAAKKINEKSAGKAGALPGGPK